MRLRASVARGWDVGCRTCSHDCPPAVRTDGLAPSSVLATLAASLARGRQGTSFKIV
jgi:hypothetical protein